MSRYLMIDFGSTFTKLTAVDSELEDIIGTNCLKKQAKSSSTRL